MNGLRVSSFLGRVAISMRTHVSTYVSFGVLRVAGGGGEILFYSQPQNNSLVQFYTFSDSGAGATLGAFYATYWMKSIM